MIKLTKELIVLLHNDLIKQTGGLNGIRDEGLLDAAVNAPFQSFDGVEQYPSIQKLSACSLLVRSPVCDVSKNYKGLSH